MMTQIEVLFDRVSMLLEISLKTRRLRQSER